jgi:hypothetical protein
LSKFKRSAVRGIRKSAHITRRVLSVGANYSGRVENKAHRIINGMDDTIKLTDKIQFDQLYYENIPYITPIHPALPRAGRSARTTLFIPSLQKSSFFGGTATALIYSGLTANASNTPLLIVETLKKGHVKIEELISFYEDNGITLNNKVELADLSPRKFNHYGYLDLHPDDILICSAWWDAYLIERLPLVKKFIYLIQDFEPIFYNNSDMYIMAESTYRSDRFVPVCNTELMLKFMTSKGYSYITDNALFFEPAVNVGKKIGIKPKKEGGKKTLFVYGRPSVERNLFYTALRVLDELFAEQALLPSEWECFMAGQDGISNVLLESGVVVHNLGKMSMDDYYDFARGVDVAVSLMMAPHPSYPPLELSSLGAAVVTTSYETKQDLSMYNDNLLVSSWDLDELKKNVLKATTKNRTDRLQSAKKTSLESDWTEALKSTVDQALKAL